MRMINPVGVANTVVYDCREPRQAQAVIPTSRSTRVGLIGEEDEASGLNQEEATGGAEDEGTAEYPATMAAAVDVTRKTGNRTPRRIRKGGTRDSSGGASTGSEGVGGSLLRPRSTPDVAADSAMSTAAEASPSSSEANFHYFDELPPWYSPRTSEDTTLVFESRFESGNLRRAIQVSEATRRAIHGSEPMSVLNLHVIIWESY